VRQVITFLATGAYVGRIPVAPGTIGSALAIPLLVWLPRLRLSPAAVVALLTAFVISSMVICDRAGSLFGDADSGRIVLDEICGMLTAGALIAPTAASLAWIFVFFRLFDIVKPPPARYFDRSMKNGIGVVADDLVAGLYANLVVRAIT
jgi:phosphatidylglycerophosphatase A